MKLIEIEKEIFINERLAKKYNAIVRFFSKNLTIALYFFANLSLIKNSFSIFINFIFLTPL